MRSTILDVARQANCSKSTVSRYLTGSELIAEETRERIARAIQELGFRPSEIGRSMQRQLSQTVGVLVPSLTNPVFASSLAGIQERARQRGLSVIVATSDYDSGIEREAVESLLAHKVSGLVLTLCDGAASTNLEAVEKEQRSFVLLFNQSNDPARLSVSVDNCGAARSMTESMIALGHQRIAFLAGHFAASDRSRLRYKGYTEAMIAAGHDPLEPLQVDFVGAHAGAIMAQTFRASAAPTALLCSTDILALAAISTLRDLGLRIPDDVSVAGFDGISIGGMVSPKLATVLQPTQEMGVMAMDILSQLMANKPVGTSFLLNHQLRLGGTLAQAPGKPRHISA